MNTPVFDVLHEDADLLVIDKPAGLVCHPTKDGEWSSVIGRVRLHLGHAEGRLVNRLDRETSGVLVVARNAAAAGELGTLFGRGAVQKHYTAIVHGHPSSDTISIEAPLGNDEASDVAIKDCVRADGAAARTDARVVRRFWRDDAPFSLIDVTPHSGRKHQIRIHLAHAGHPIVGDKLYGGDEHAYLRFTRGELTSEDRRRLILEQHALHARRLSFAWRGETWTFEAPVSEVLAHFSREDTVGASS